MMSRTMIGAALAAAGTLGVAAGTYLDWYAGAPRATGIPLAALFQASPAGITTEFWGSLAAPLVLVGAIGVLGVIVRSRVTFALAASLAAFTVGMWTLMRIIEGEFEVSGVGPGMWLAVAGVAVIVVGILAMGSRREITLPLSVFDGDPPQ
jgi:hypothetical protein